MLSTILLQAAGMGVAKMGATIGAGLAPSVQVLVLD